MINNHEQLVGYEEIADFTSLPAMIKEFKPYFDLWTTVEEWKKSYNSWLNDPFDEVDAGKVEETVDNSIKTLSGVIRFFKSKELSQITKIAETLKADVDLFKPEVPVLMALRTDGMKDRHWDMLTQAIGFEVRPYEGFTYSKCMELGLVA